MFRHNHDVCLPTSRPANRSRRQCTSLRDDNGQSNGSSRAHDINGATSRRRQSLSSGIACHVRRSVSDGFVEERLIHIVDTICGSNRSFIFTSYDATGNVSSLRHLAEKQSSQRKAAVLRNGYPKLVRRAIFRVPRHASAIIKHSHIDRSASDARHPKCAPTCCIPDRRIAANANSARQTAEFDMLSVTGYTDIPSDQPQAGQLTAQSADAQRWCHGQRFHVLSITP